MRWSQYIGSLSQPVGERLVNVFTAGSGDLVIAARMARADRPAQHVLALLATALASLSEARRLLLQGALANGPVTSRCPLEAQPASGTWRDLLESLPPGVAEDVEDALERGVEQARLAVRVSTADGEVEVVQLYLDAAVEALARLFRLTGRSA
jgi:hypothetical protein